MILDQKKQWKKKNLMIKVNNLFINLKTNEKKNEIFLDFTEMKEKKILKSKKKNKSGGFQSFGTYFFFYHR